MKEFKQIIVQPLAHKDKENIGLHIILNRPKKGNALTPIMMQEIIFVLDNMLKLWHAVLAISGNGTYFCTGMDLGAAQGGDMDGNNDNSLDFFQSFFEKLNSLPQLTIGIMNGPAFGGGVGLLFCLDIRIACSTFTKESKLQNNYLQLPEVKRGIIPALISPYLIQSMSVGFMNELFLGAAVTVERIWKLGYIHALISGSDITNRDGLLTFKTVSEALSYYLDLKLNAAPLAFAKCKQLNKKLRQSETDWKFNQKIVKDAFGEMMQSEEAQKGISAFLMRQSVEWYDQTSESKSKL